MKTVQLNCMVNRELTRRVKVGPESTWASRAVHKDIHLLLRLVTALDKKTGLWDNGEEENGKVRITQVDVCVWGGVGGWVGGCGCGCGCVDMCACVHACTCVCAHPCVCARVCVHACTCICVYVRVCMHMLK